MTRKLIFAALNRLATDPDATRRAQHSIESRARHYMKLGAGRLAHAIANVTETELTPRQLGVTVEALLMADYLESLSIESANRQRKTGNKRQA